MVRREEQPWQARCTLLLDTRRRAHGGEGPGSSFEWAVAAAASVGVHLARHGFVVRLLTDHGATVTNASTHTSPIHDPGRGDNDIEGALLDTLAVIDGSDNDGLRDAAASLRRGGDGLLVAMIGALDPEEARALARLRHGTAAAVAIALDTATWSGAVGRARRTGADYEGSVALLRASGWRVIRARAGDSLPDLWPEAGRAPSPGVPVPTAAGAP